MRSPSCSSLEILALAVALTAAGCASNPAPHGFLAEAGQEIYDARGAWIELELIGTKSGSGWLNGELLATDADSVHVLVPMTRDSRRGRVLSFEWGEVRTWRARAYDRGTGTYAAYTAAGTVSTLSHGLFLVISAPVWLIAGSAITGAESRAADFDETDRQSELRPWARFPQGLPPGLDVEGLTLRFDAYREDGPVRFRAPARDWSEY